jgi:carbonic anhydrase/acetyltransferase-like protein (isoleucine patch superfamily)
VRAHQAIYYIYMAMAGIPNLASEVGLLLMPVLPFGNYAPKIDPLAYISPRSTIVGQVAIGEHSSVWDYASIRGDWNLITIGTYSSIQDNVSVHVTQKSEVEVGDFVTVGHNAVLHGCTVGNEVIIGLGARVLDGAIIAQRTLVAAGAVVTSGMEVPPNSLVIGIPGKVTEFKGNPGLFRASAEEYATLALEYKQRFEE